MAKRRKKKTKTQKIIKRLYKITTATPHAMEVGDTVEIKEPKRKKISYFPIVVRLCDTQEIRMVKEVDYLPQGRSFVIIQTNYNHN